MTKLFAILAFSIATLMGGNQHSISSVETRNGWVYMYDETGRKYQTISESSVGEVIGVAGDTFTSRNHGWIYTWSKEGRKINTRSAN